MRVQMLSRLADRFALRYRSHLNALIGELGRTLSGPEPTSGAARMKFRRSADEMGMELSRVEVGSIRRLTSSVVSAALDDVLTQAQATSGRYEREHEVQIAKLREFASEDAEAVANALRAQISRDRMSAERHLRYFAQEVDAQMAHTGWRQHSAIIAVRERIGLPKFTYLDKAGRRWGSERFVRVLVNNHLFSTYNEAFIYAATWLGHREFQVKTLDPKHRNAGLRFSYGERREPFALYDDIRAKVFHPNSRAIVAL